MNKSLSNGTAQDNVDGLLRAFFRREIPDPWPEAGVPMPARTMATPRSWFRSFGRIVVAASVAVLLVSYLTLAGMFPPNSGSGLDLNRNQTIGSKPGVKQLVPTPRGGEALLWEETIPGERPTIIFHLQQVKGPQKR